MLDSEKIKFHTDLKNLSTRNSHNENNGIICSAEKMIILLAFNVTISSNSSNSFGSSRNIKGIIRFVIISFH